MEHLWAKPSTNLSPSRRIFEAPGARQVLAGFFPPGAGCDQEVIPQL